MRAYFFTNMYLSSIQHGIQAAHALSEMYSKYDREFNEGRTLHNWGATHKTIIILNGGGSYELNELCEFFYSVSNGYPWAFFTESEFSLNGALTCVGVILPERIYKTAEAVKNGGSWCQNGDYWMVREASGEYDICSYWSIQDITNNEKKLIDRLNQYSLAR